MEGRKENIYIHFLINGLGKHWISAIKSLCSKFTWQSQKLLPSVTFDSFRLNFLVELHIKKKIKSVFLVGTFSAKKKGV